MQLHNHSSQMFIENYSSYVHLGCSSEERAHKQEVRFSIEVKFNSNPNGETSDKLEETLCYAKVCGLIDELTVNEHYQLIEKLAHKVLITLKQLQPEDQITVICHKVHPPVQNLFGGVKYVCTSE